MKKIILLLALLAIQFKTTAASCKQRIGCKPSAKVTCVENVEANEVTTFYKKLNLSPLLSKVFHQELYTVDPDASVGSAQPISYVKLAENRYLLNVSLGKLSATQFNYLKSYFALFRGSRTQEFQAEKHYNLSYFLPNAARALLNHRFVTQRTKIRSLTTDEKLHLELEKKYGSQDNFLNYVDQLLTKTGGVHSVTNCWNTALELTKNIFGQNEFKLYWPGRIQVSDLLQDSKEYFVEVQTPVPGDLMVVEYTTPDSNGYYYLSHAAVYIQPGIVFEKTDSTDYDPYRLSLIEDTLKWSKRNLPNSRIRFLRAVKHLGNAINGVSLSETIQSEFPRPNLDINDFLPESLHNKQLVTGHELRFGGGFDENVTIIETIQFKEEADGSVSIVAPDSLKSRFKAFKAQGL